MAVLRAFDSLGLCMFSLIMGRPPILEWLNAATGWDYGEDDFFRVGKHIQLLRHAFNAREGLPKVFPLPGRERGDPPQEVGPVAGVTLDMEAMVEGYFKMMGMGEG
jgi:aldehyde:ferredoxin oxidoreductase